MPGFATVLFLSVTVFAGALSATETGQPLDDEAWLDDDAEFRSLEVNEGVLTFIAPVADKKTLHSDSVLSISEDSLITGWVHLQQCYFNISAVAETDIVYHYRQMRNFKITSASNIGKAVAAEQLLTLYDIENDASICVSAEVNVLDRKGESYVITSGPYHLRFLDGYYPYHVTLRINYPAALIRLKKITPPPQPYFKLQTVDSRLSIDGWFEGELLIQLEFEKMSKAITE